MSKNWPAMAESVQTEADFLEFARVLLADWHEEQNVLKQHPGPRYDSLQDGWENGDIGGFLSGLIRWAEDIDKNYRYDAPPSWSLFAFMLLAGSRYE